MTAGRPELRVVDLGRMPYGDALATQETTVAQRKRNGVADTLLLVEHDPVFTLGRNADRANITATAEELALRGVRVFETGRGGQVTYHGPGQLVGYPILRLDTRAKGPVWYVGRLEDMLLATLAAFGLEAETDPENRGVWIGGEKIAAIGVRITQHVTMHGFSLNVQVEPEDYRGMIPCGIRGKGVTSLHRLGVTADMDRVKQQVIRSFREVFGYDETG